MKGVLLGFVSSLCQRQARHPCHMKCNMPAIFPLYRADKKAGMARSPSPPEVLDSLEGCVWPHIAIAMGSRDSIAGRVLSPAAILLLMSMMMVNFSGLG